MGSCRIHRVLVTRFPRLLILLVLVSTMVMLVALAPCSLESGCTFRCTRQGQRSHYLTASPFKSRFRPITSNVPYENCSHFCDCFRFVGGRCFRFGGSNNIFNPCSYIELNTQNPNPILKFAICFTKTQNCQNTFEILEKIRKSKNVFKECILYFV